MKIGEFVFDESRQISYLERVDYCKDRFSYLSEIDFGLENVNCAVRMRIDTGATKTIIGIDLLRKSIPNIDDLYLKFQEEKTVFAANDKEIYIRSAVVRNFQITDEIKIEKIKIYFSDNIGNRALLGMDILSLFTFMYSDKDRLFTIHNYKESIERHNKLILNSNLDYLDPEFIGEISEKNPVR